MQAWLAFVRTAVPDPQTGSNSEADARSVVDTGKARKGLEADCSCLGRLESPACT